jgi:hypothetical protein
VPERLDTVRFLVGDQELEVAWDLAVEIRESCHCADDAAARDVAARMHAVGATRPVALSRGQLAALLVVLEQWDIEAETGRRLRLALVDELE